MSTLRTPNNIPAEDNPNVDGTLRPEEFAKDQTLRPSNDSSLSDSINTMDTTYISDENSHDMKDAAGDCFILKGVRYINKQCLSENSGEAQVYLVERDGEEYVLKIYYPNFNVNKKLLQAIYNFKFEMIVSLYDYGKTYVDAKHRYYELMEYLENGNIVNAVNLPGVKLPRSGVCRVCIIHKNVPTVLTSITSAFSDSGMNIENLINKSRRDMAYSMIDLDTKVSEAMLEKVAALPNVIRVRALV
jgi:hypothetical protein